jgi:hypothetical protein
MYAQSGRSADHALGAVTLLPAGVGALLLVRETRHGGLERRWWGVPTPLLVAGLLVGGWRRVMTAGVIGAKTGAGLVVLFGGPVVAGLLLWAPARGVRPAARRRCDGDGDGDGDGGQGGRWRGFAPRGA